MQTSRTLLVLVSGAVVGAGLVLACGDDAPAVDAAGPDAPVCDCPAAEAPITDGRIEVVSMPVTIPADDRFLGAAGCTAPAVLVSGGCWIDNPPAPRGIFLTTTGREPSGTLAWLCQWDNTTASPVNATIEAICLNPAE